MCHFQKEHVVQVCMKIIITDMRTRSLKTVNTSLFLRDQCSWIILAVESSVCMWPQTYNYKKLLVPKASYSYSCIKTTLCI